MGFCARIGWMRCVSNRCENQNRVLHCSPFAEKWRSSNCSNEIPSRCCQKIFCWTGLRKVEREFAYPEVGDVGEISMNILDIYGVDFRHFPSVQDFIVHVLGHYKRIDILYFLFYYVSLTFKSYAYKQRSTANPETPGILSRATRSGESNFRRCIRF